MEEMIKMFLANMSKEQIEDLIKQAVSNLDKNQIDVIINQALQLIDEAQLAELMEKRGDVYDIIHYAQQICDIRSAIPMNIDDAKIARPVIIDLWLNTADDNEDFCYFLADLNQKLNKKYGSNETITCELINTYFKDDDADNED